MQIQQTGSEYIVQLHFLALMEFGTRRFPTCVWVCVSVVLQFIELSRQSCETVRCIALLCIRLIIVGFQHRHYCCSSGTFYLVHMNLSSVTWCDGFPAFMTQPCIQYSLSQDSPCREGRWIKARRSALLVLQVGD